MSSQNPDAECEEYGEEDLGGIANGHDNHILAASEETATGQIVILVSPQQAVEYAVRTNSGSSHAPNSEGGVQSFGDRKVMVEAKETPHTVRVPSEPNKLAKPPTSSPSHSTQESNAMRDKGEDVLLEAADRAVGAEDAAFSALASNGWVWEQCSADDFREQMQRLKIRDASINRMVPAITPGTSLVTLLEDLQHNTCVVLHDATGERVLTRREVVSRALVTGGSLCTVQHWLHHKLPRFGLSLPDEPRRAQDSDSLLSAMPLLAQGATELVVQDAAGSIIGVLTCEELLAKVNRDVVLGSRKPPQASAGHVTEKKEIRFGASEAAVERELALRAAAPRSPQARRALFLVEVVLALLLLLDIVLAIYDMVVYSPCVDCDRDWGSSDRFDTTSDPEVRFASAADCHARLHLLECDMSWSLANPFNVAMIALTAIFFVESLVRLFWHRHSLSLVLLLDTAIIWASVVVSLWFFTAHGDKVVRQALACARVVRFLRCLRKSDELRQFISKEKNRYQENGFDLDLSYITDSIIAMSLPAQGLEAHYRNPAEEVVRFFRTMHQDADEPRYLVVNLCAERQYSPQLFDGNMTTFPTEDHNPCLMEQMCLFVERCEQFRASHPDNVVAVHCKGGKGRTGLMVCTWLLYSGFVGSSQPVQERVQEALQWFALRRTGKKAKHDQTVQQPSQRRYLEYFCRSMDLGGYQTPMLYLTKIVLHSTPRMDADGGCDPWFTIDQGFREVFDYSKGNQVLHVAKGTAAIELACPRVELRGDVRINFFDHDEMPPRDEKMFFFWFHTGFVEGLHLRLEKTDLDGACKDTKNKVYGDDFAVELFFEAVPHTCVPNRRLDKVSQQIRDGARGERERAVAAWERTSSNPARWGSFTRSPTGNNSRSRSGPRG